MKVYILEVVGSRERHRHQGSRHMNLPGRTEPQPSSPGAGLSGSLPCVLGKSPEQGSEQGGKSPWIQEGVFLKGFIHFHFFFFDRKSKLASNSWPFCLGLQEARMTGIVPHQATSALTEEENYLL